MGVPALGAWTFAMSTVILPLTVIAIPIAEVLFSAFSRLQGERERMAALWLRAFAIWRPSSCRCWWASSSSPRT